MASNDRDVLAMSLGGAAVVSSRAEGSVDARTPRILTGTAEQIFHPRFAPDGRWLVYVARERFEDPLGIFAQAFPGPGRRQQVASAGIFPEWRGDGKEIVYVDSGAVWSVPVETIGQDLRLGTPRKLFSALLRAPAGPGLPARQLAVSRDGTRFFFPVRLEQAETNLIHVRTAWSTP